MLFEKNIIELMNKDSHALISLKEILWPPFTIRVNCHNLLKDNDALDCYGGMLRRKWSNQNR